MDEKDVADINIQRTQRRAHSYSKNNLIWGVKVNSCKVYIKGLQRYIQRHPINTQWVIAVFVVASIVRYIANVRNG